MGAYKTKQCSRIAREVMSFSAIFAKVNFLIVLTTTYPFPIKMVHFIQGISLENSLKTKVKRSYAKNSVILTQRSVCSKLIGFTNLWSKMHRIHVTAFYICNFSNGTPCKI